MSTLTLPRIQPRSVQIVRALIRAEEPNEVCAILDHLATDEDLERDVHDALAYYADGVGLEFSWEFPRSQIVTRSKIIDFLDQISLSSSHVEENLLVDNKHKMFDALGHGGKGEQAMRIFGSGYKTKSERKPVADRRDLPETGTFLALNAMLTAMRKTVLSTADRHKLQSTIIETALDPDQLIPLDDGTTAPASDLFRCAPRSSYGGTLPTFYADSRTQGYLMEKNGWLPIITEEEQKRFISVTDINEKLGRDHKSAFNLETRQLLLALRGEFPDDIILRRNTSGRSTDPYTVFADFPKLEAILRKKLLCTRKASQEHYLPVTQALLELKVSVRTENTQALIALCQDVADSGKYEGRVGKFLFQGGNRSTDDGSVWFIDPQLIKEGVLTHEKLQDKRNQLRAQISVAAGKDVTLLPDDQKHLVPISTRTLISLGVTGSADSMRALEQRCQELHDSGKYEKRIGKFLLQDARRHVGDGTGWHIDPALITEGAISSRIVTQIRENNLNHQRSTEGKAQTRGTEHAHFIPQSHAARHMHLGADASYRIALSQVLEALQSDPRYAARVAKFFSKAGRAGDGTAWYLDPALLDEGVITREQVLDIRKQNRTTVQI